MAAIEKSRRVPPSRRSSAIDCAARVPRRELWAGATTPLVIMGSLAAATARRRYLAKTNVDAQQTGEPRPGVGAMTSTRRCSTTAARTPVR